MRGLFLRLYMIVKMCNFERHTWKFLQFRNQHQCFFSQQKQQRRAGVWDVQWHHLLPYKLPEVPVEVTDLQLK